MKRFKGRMTEIGPVAAESFDDSIRMMKKSVTGNSAELEENEDQLRGVTALVH